MKNKKGFTLVEIIVVLVILAILAAIAVPSVIGYVNEAKESRYIQEAHSIYTVVETEVAKYKATDNPSEDAIDNYIKDILSGNTIATADNNQLKGIIAKKTELDDVDVERNGNTYTINSFNSSFNCFQLGKYLVSKDVYSSLCNLTLICNNSCTTIYSIQ